MKTRRLESTDSIKNWIEKINDSIELPHVDGSFTIVNSDFNTLDLNVRGGNVTYDGDTISIPDYLTTLSSGYTYIVGIDLNVDEIIAYQQGSEPNTYFIPIYIITTDIDSVSAFSDMRTWVMVSSTGTGQTVDRPTSPRTGFRFFDTDLGYPIWFNGINWVNAMGTTI